EVGDERGGEVHEDAVNRPYGVSGLLANDAVVDGFLPAARRIHPGVVQRLERGGVLVAERRAEQDRAPGVQLTQLVGRTAGLLLLERVRGALQLGVGERVRLDDRTVVLELLEVRGVAADRVQAQEERDRYVRRLEQFGTLRELYPAVV